MYICNKHKKFDMKYKIKYKHLQTRKITKFTWLPTFIKTWDIREFYWLTYINVEQEWCSFGYDWRIKIFGGYWENVRTL